MGSECRIVEHEECKHDECKRDECKSPFGFFDGLFDGNIIWIIILVVLVFSSGIFGKDNEGSCGFLGGLFDDNIIWIILLIVLVGPMLGFGEHKDCII